MARISTAQARLSPALLQIPILLPIFLAASQVSGICLPHLHTADLLTLRFSGQENIAPASCILLSCADGSVVAYRLPLALTPSGAWDKVPGSVLCLASDGNEIVAMGLSSGHVMIFDRHDMRAVFCSQNAQAAPGAAVLTPSRIQLRACSSSHDYLVIARFSDGSLRMWKLSPCALPGLSPGHVGVAGPGAFLNCAEAPVMKLLQVCLGAKFGHGVSVVK